MNILDIVWIGNDGEVRKPENTSPVLSKADLCDGTIVCAVHSLIKRVSECKDGLL